jgi:hypothetical protein
MTRKGRELERLVATLEKAMAHESVEVNSPDYIEDKDTGETRKVDADKLAAVTFSEFSSGASRSLRRTAVRDFVPGTSYACFGHLLA